MKPVLGLALALLLTATTAAAQQPAFTSRVSVVRIDALATDGTRPLMNLEAGDFQVLDNGVPQHVESAFGDAEPIDVLFAFDRSESTRGETLLRLRESATALLDALQPTDRAGLLTFNHTFSLAVPLGPADDVRDALQSIEPGGSTSVLDAVATTIALASNNERRTLVLLFTDGVDTLSWLPEKTVLEAARGSEAVMYAVTLPERRNNPQPLMGDEGQLKRIVEASGGRLLRADRPAQLRERFIEALGEMRARYVLTYTPTDPDTPGWHALSVTLRGRKGRVAARAGYVVPPPQR